MFKTHTKISLFTSLMAVIMLSCATPGDQDYRKTKSGLLYKKHITNKDAPKPQIDDILTVDMKYLLNDSVLFDSRELMGEMQFPLMEPSFQGDFFEGLAEMHKGDSATFWSPADSVMLILFRTGELPPFVKSGDTMRFEVRLIDFDSQEAMAEKMKEKAEKDRLSAVTKLEDYLEAQNITVEPQESGLYYIEIKEGEGPKPFPGQGVSVHYTGKLLDGTKFDSSHDRGEPIAFFIGRGQVIPGWDEGIAMMRKGGQAKLIIPPELAYGERDMGVIPPHSPLVFEVELVDIDY